MTYDIVEGTSSGLQFQLLENGVAINLVSLTPTLLLEDRLGVTLGSPGTVTVSDSANGIVTFTPLNSGVFIAANGPYLARWVLTTTLGSVSYIPSSIRDTWNIVGL